MTRDEILNMPAGREMDALIAEKVMGWVWAHSPEPYISGWYKKGSGGDFTQSFEPSTDISAAWEVVDKMDEKFSFILECNNPPSTIEYKWFCELYAKCEPYIDYEVYSSTAPLAICRAALLAKLE
jgi:hypothetical protein